MRLRDRLLACGLAEIAGAETALPLKCCRCLVPRGSGLSEAAAQELSRRCGRVDRQGEEGAHYDLILLLREQDESELCAFFHRETLVLDAVQARGHSVIFDPNTPYRRVRILAMQEKHAKEG